MPKAWLRLRPDHRGAPGNFADAVPVFPVQERAGGTWVELPDLPEHVRTVGDVVVEMLVACGGHCGLRDGGAL